MANDSFDSPLKQVPECEFRAIPGYEAVYAINAQGVVRKFNKRKNTYVLKTGTVMTNGYVHINLKDEPRKFTSYYIHRLVMLTFRYRENAEQYQVNHLDGNRSNNNLENLEWCTARENVQHSYQILNRKPARLGHKGANCKLTPSQALEVKRLAEAGMLQKDIALLYGVCKKTISRTIRSKR